MPPTRVAFFILMVSYTWLGMQIQNVILLLFLNIILYISDAKNVMHPQYGFMKKIYALLALLVSLLVGKNALAAITVTPATNGTGICANLAIGGTTPGFTTLGTITVAEGAVGDITTGFRTLVINAPAGWQFNTGAAPTINFTPGRNITFAVNGGFTATQLTIFVNVSAATLLDAITIAGLQVQATSTGAAAGNIRASSATGFTGITTGVTNFGSLSLTPSLTPSVTVVATPGSTVCAGTTVTFNATPVNAGAPTYQWKINGVATPGATLSFFTSNTLTTGDVVQVTITPTGCVNATTATSAPMTMVVNPIPTAVIVTGGGGFCASTTLNASNGGSGTIYYEGTTPMGTSTATPSTSQVITTSGTYYFRAQSAGCWGPQGSATVSINTLPITITPSSSATLCLGDSTTFTANATPFPVTLLTQDFNSGFAGWSITNLDGNSTSFFQVRSSPGYLSNTPGDGTPMMEAAADATGSPALPTHTMVTSPSFSLVGYSGATVSFNQYYQAWSTGDTTVAIEYSIDGGTTWTTVVDQAGTTTGNTTWVAGAPDLTLTLPSAVAEQPNVMIRWNYNSDWGWYWAIDNVVISGIPTLTYTWTGIAGATGLSCTSCPSPTITPTAAGANVYSVSTTYGGCPSSPASGVTINVNPLPALFTVTGGGSYCVPGAGVSVGLSGSEVGVDYQLYNGATVGSPIAGTGSALDFGLQTTAGTYTVLATNTSTGCSRMMTGSAVVIVNSGATAYNVVGGGSFCAGGTGVDISLTGSDVGVVYQLYNGASMSGGPIGGTGSPLDFGLQVIAGTYTVQATDMSTGCISAMNGSAVVVVNPLPAAFAVTGGGNYCAGGSGVSVGTSGSEIGVDYQLYNGASAVGATIPGTGAALDFGLQTPVGTYSVRGTNTTTGCTGGMTGTVNITTSPAPAAIGGPTQVCAGSTITLTDTTTGGTWSSSDVSIVTIDATTGIATGVTAGTATISYAVSTGCSATITFTVNPLPVVAVITGTFNLCVGGTTTLSDATPGGTWSSSATGIATIDAGGVVTAVSAGTTTISYSVTDGLGCTGYATAVDSVTAYPALGTIGGSAALCLGGSSTLTDTYPGGTWSSSDITIADIDPVSGVVTGMALGTATITYTASNTLGCTSTVTIAATVNPLPTVAPITGAGTVCGGLTITLSDSTAGGIWTSSNTTTATVGSSTGIVTGGAIGVVTISYTVTSGAGCTATMTTTLNVGAMMPVVDITPVGPSATLCHGNPVNLVTVTSGSGLTYQWYEGGTPITGATNYYYVASTPGIYSVVVDNGTCAMTLPSKTVIAKPNPVISYNSTGHYLFTGSYSSYQWYLNGATIAGANSSIFTPTVSGSYVVVVTDGNGCSDTSAPYIFTPAGVNGPATAAEVNIYPNPTASTLFIDASTPVNIVIMTVDGKIVIDQKNTKSVNIAQLPDGLYLIKVYDQNSALIKTAKVSKIN